VGTPRRLKIVHKAHGVVAIPAPDEPRNDQLGVGINRGPRPCIAVSQILSFRGRDILLPGIGKRPDFVDLYSAGFYVANSSVMKAGASLSGVDQQLGHGVDRHVADAPEQVVFNQLKKQNWGNLWSRIGRDISLVDDACSKAMTLAAHHEWIRLAANQLKCGGDTLWQAMCAEWASKFAAGEARKVIRPIEETI
jgi:hypothetical protein